MKILKDWKELKKELLKNKEKYIGKVLIDKYGNEYVIVDITEEGIKCYPIERMERGVGF